MLSTLQLLAALGLLIFLAEASQDHGREPPQIQGLWCATNRLKLFAMRIPQRMIQPPAGLQLVHLNRLILLQSITVIPLSKPLLPFKRRHP
jgi:hypothetical protein